MIESIKEQLHKVKVTGNLKISETSGILKFHRWFDFHAGQVVNITTHETLPPRMYSICSSEKNNEIELLYKIVPDGELTPQLSKLKPGDKLLVSEAFGKFLGSNDTAWLIATGTGIAPFMSMLRSGQNTNKILLHGSRSIEDFYFSEELYLILKENYIRCFTGNDPTKFYKGRVNQYLNQLSGVPVKLKYYLCGSAEMVVDTRQLLISKGVAFQNIQSEIYF